MAGSTGSSGGSGYGNIYGAAISAGGGIISSIINNAWAGEQAKKDRRENYIFSEFAANNADKRTRALYKDFYSPEALLRQYEAAGLSPSMMFGGTPGQGGMSGAQGNGGSGIQTPYMPISMVEMAQAAALFAQAKKQNAETDVIEGKNEMGMSAIAKQWAEAGHQEAAAAAQKASAAGMQLDNYVKEHTKEASIFTLCELAEKAGYETEKAYNEAKKSGIDLKMSEELYDTNIQRARKELEAIATSISEAQSRIKLNEQQKQNLRNEVLVSFDTVAQKWKELDIKEKEQTTYTDWINAQMPYIEKQLEIKLKELGIERRRVITQTITETLKALALGAATVSKLNNATVPSVKGPGQAGEIPQSTLWY